MKNLLRAGALAAVIPFLAGCGASGGEPEAGTPDGAVAPSARPEPSTPAHGPGPDFEIAAGRPFDDVAGETHLRNVRQLTFEGENAEAYFSFDGTRLVYQRTPAEPEGACDQIYALDLATGEQAPVSTGEGRTTCAYFYPGGERVLYSSTHLASPDCPAPPDFSRGYVWAIYPGYDIFVADVSGAAGSEGDAASGDAPAGAASAADGSGPVRLTDTPGYDAEATFSPMGDRIVFTSVRDGDLDLYSMAPDGSDVRRLTDRPGYDGGAFYSPDGSKLVWRAHYPETEEELADYRALLADGLIRPTTLEIWVADADGSNARQLTSNGAANFGPYWHPSGDRILFSSNMDDPTGRDFDIYSIRLDGTGLTRVTHTPGFDGFPVFSPDGRFFVWGSNRNPSHAENTNVFIAEWVEDGGAAGGAG